MALRTLSGDFFEIIAVRENEAHQAFSSAICSSKGWEEGLLSSIRNYFGCYVPINKRHLKNIKSHLVFQ